MERKLKGFTIIELMVVAAILAVLCAISVPAALTWVRDSRIRDANEEARLVYSAVQDYLTELEIKNIEVKESSSSPDTMNMYSCSTDNNLPNPISATTPRDQVAEYGAFYSAASVNPALKGKGLNLSGALGDSFEGVWAVKFNMNTYTVVEAYWTPYIDGATAQTDVTAAAAFTSGSDQDAYYRANGVAIGKFPI